MNARKLAIGMAAASTLSGLALFGVVTPASAATCPSSHNVRIEGGQSNYTLSCSGGKVYVEGRVKDTWADGFCIRVKALIDGQWKYSEPACPSGTTKHFSWSGNGNSASVYTYAYN